MPNARITRVQLDRQPISRELQNFYYKTCQFLRARRLISVVFIGTVFFKLETAS